MEKEFIPYKQALELKELGFDEPCFAHYTSHGYYNSENELKWKRPTFTLCGGITITNDSLTWQEDPNVIIKQVIAPTFSQAFRWFREKYNLWNMIYPRDGWNYTIQEIDNIPSVFGQSYHNTEMKTYEEAELECLKKLIKICKNN